MNRKTADGPLINPSRRDFFLKMAGLGGIALLGTPRLAAAGSNSVLLPFAHGERPLVAYPQKRPLMLMTARPVQLETPFPIFNESLFTPNDAFFVRWHLADFPTRIDSGRFTVNVHGRIKKPLRIRLQDLRTNYDTVEVAAVCQCAGNSRGFFQPRVAGGQWGHGAMGNALWQGVRLRDLLNQAGLKGDAIQVRFNGADKPVLAGTPDFLKSLDIDTALREDVILAYRMNNEPLPLLNGFPLRLIVPGWYATYWIKAVNDIEVLNQVDTQFWMQSAYRIPADPCACVEPGTHPARTVPISRMNVRSFITSVAEGGLLKSGRVHTISGIAFDGGSGIRKVLFSTDGGRHWMDAKLHPEHGKYSFRQWEARFTPKPGHDYRLACLAINHTGESQSSTPRWNPAGYMRNVVETVNVKGV